MSETATARFVCRWCGRGVVEGNAIADPLVSDPAVGAFLHVECSARMRLHQRDWRDSERTPIGEAFRLVAGICESVESGETIVLGPESPLWARVRLAVLRAKGERP